MRPTIETLESRRLLTAYVVDSLLDGPAAADGNLTLREAIIASSTNAASGDAAAGDGDGDTISFASGLGGGTITLTNGVLTISDDLTINGSGVTVDAAGASRAFTVDTGDEVAFSNFTVTGGNADNGGGVFVSDGGDVTFIDVSLTGNTATGADAANGGGGLFVEGGTVGLVNSSVTNNLATGASGSGSGGGIFVLDGTVAAQNTSITGNVANRAGGGVEIVDGSFTQTLGSLSGNVAGPDGTAAPGNGGGLHVSGTSSSVTIDRTGVVGNDAASEGGGLWNQSGSTMTVTGATLESNTASGDDADNGGGGIFNNGGTLAVSNASINSNVADGASGSGGGIFSTGGDVTVVDTTILSNTANRAGGGVEVVDGTYTQTRGRLSLNVAGPDGSAAPGNGGGLHVSGMSGTNVQINNVFVEANAAALEGGGLWNQAGSTMTVTNATVQGNTASGDDADTGGGGLFNNGGTLNLVAGRVASNSANGASGSGGGLLTVDGDVTVNRTTFSSNGAVRAGGAVEIIDGSFTSINATYAGNLAGFGGVAAPGNGGALHVSGMSGTTVTFTGGNVTGNVAASEGGGLWNQAGSTMNVDNVFVQNNVASGADADNGGGGLFNNGGTLNLNDVRVLDNAANGASGSGGGLLSTGGDVTITTDDTGNGLFGFASRFQGNVANRAGGGIEIIDGTLTMTGGRLLTNVAGPSGSAAPGNGGALHVSGIGGTTTTLDGVTVWGNTAASEGGGLWNQSGSTMIVTDSRLRGNVAAGDDADNGGGALFNNGGTLTVSNTSLANNAAGGTSGSGGALFSTGGTVALDTVRLQSNLANRAGGGAEIVDGTFGTTDSLFRLNIAGPSGSANPGNGGGFHVTGNATIDFADTDFRANTAAAEGGGFWNQAGSTLTMTGGVVLRNNALGDAADDGGAGVFNNGGTLTMSNVSVDGNIASGASGSGGGLFSTAGVVTLNDVDFLRNEANRAGGAIEVVDGSVDINGGQYGFNIAGRDGSANPGNGGAIHVTGMSGTTVDIADGDFVSNTAASEGGALWNQSGSTMNVTNTIIRGNVALGTDADNGGGGIFNNGGTMSVGGGSSIFNNSADDGVGGGLYNGPGGGVLLGNVSITGNSASSGGGAFTAAGATTTVGAGASVTDNDPDDLAGPGTVA